MDNLIAYIPTLNSMHLKWFKEHAPSKLLLIPQEIAEALIPRLSRNIVAVPTETMVVMLRSHEVPRLKFVAKFSPGWYPPELLKHEWPRCFLPHEDVSLAFAEKYLSPAGCEPTYEDIWARYDMQAVHANQPVIPDMEISIDASDQSFMDKALAVAKRSPDWWRQVGAAAFSPQGELMAAACNTHMPTEYETYIFGDPAINRDAGQSGKSCALHAEEAVVALCAREGRSLEGAHLYVTVFPCETCARVVSFAGVKRIYFRDGYSSLNAQEVLRAYGVRIVQVKY